MNCGQEIKSKEYFCQIWNPEIYKTNIETIEAPFSTYTDNSHLALYNKRPTAVRNRCTTITTLSSEGKWKTVATLAHFLKEITLIGLDSGELLIIGIDDQEKWLDLAEMNILQNGEIRTVEKLNKVFYKNSSPKIGNNNHICQFFFFKV